eukprot:4001661-Heterocapsa_arctica.AAC.1
MTAEASADDRGSQRHQGRLLIHLETESFETKTLDVGKRLVYTVLKGALSGRRRQQREPWVPWPCKPGT